MDIETIEINTEFIKLGQLLKLADLVDTGADAKHAIIQGNVKLNQDICYQRGKKVRDGDIVMAFGKKIKVIEKK